MTTDEARKLTTSELLDASCDPFSKHADIIKSEISKRLYVGEGLALAFAKIEATRNEYEKKSGKQSFKQDSDGLPAGHSDGYILWLQRCHDAADRLADHCQRILNAATLPAGYDNELADLLAAYRGAT